MGHTSLILATCVKVPQQGERSKNKQQQRLILPAKKIVITVPNAGWWCGLSKPQ